MLRDRRTGLLGRGAPPRVDDRQGGLPRGEGVEMLEATFISMSVSIRGMTDHGASSQAASSSDFSEAWNLSRKSMEDSMPDPPTLTLSPPFHIGYKDSPQSRSESTRSLSVTLTFPRSGLHPPVGVTCSAPVSCCLKGMCWCWLPPAVLLCDVTGQWV